MRCTYVSAGTVDMQYVIGTKMLGSVNTHSHLAHSIETLHDCNTIPGNSYGYVQDKSQLQPKLRAVAMDSGTWPMDGGGVATCREQVLQGTDDVEWIVQAEVANDMKQVNTQE